MLSAHLKRLHHRLCIELTNGKDAESAQAFLYLGLYLQQLSDRRLSLLGDAILGELSKEDSRPSERGLESLREVLSS